MLIFKSSPNDPWLKTLEEEYVAPVNNDELMDIIADAFNEHTALETQEQ